MYQNITRPPAPNLGKVAILAAALFIASIAKAQDIIVLKNGDETKAIVSKIGTDEIEYKQYYNQDGPTYTLKKSEIFMIKYANGHKDVFSEKEGEKQNNWGKPKVTDEVKQTSTGTQNKLQYLGWAHGKNKIRDNSGKELSKTEILNILVTYPDALSYYEQGVGKQKKGLGWRTTAYITSIGALALSIIGGSKDYNGDKSKAKPYFTAGYICLGVGVLSLIPQSNLLKSGSDDVLKAVNIYNDAVSKKRDVSLNLGIMQSGGVGLILNF